MTVDKLCSFLCARLEKIKIINISSYFMRMLRLSEKVWMYFTFHIQIYKLSHPKNYSVSSLFGKRTSRKLFCHWLLVFYGVVVCWTCLFTIISCMFNLMIIMCSPEIVSAFVHVFDLEFLHFKKMYFRLDWKSLLTFSNNKYYYFIAT